MTYENVQSVTSTKLSEMLPEEARLQSAVSSSQTRFTEILALVSISIVGESLMKFVNL
jgi:hypothetical protein